MRNVKMSLLMVVAFAACNGGVQPESVRKPKTEPRTQSIMMVAMDKSMAEMHHAKQTGNADYDFAAMMIPHHKGALAMAEAIIKSSKSDTLVHFSRGLVAQQRKEIDLLEAFLSTADQTPSKEATKVKRELMASMAAMMGGMDNWKSSGRLEHDFLTLMIPHHQSAVDMAKAYLPYAKRPEIEKLAKDIINGQQEEIKWMKTKIEAF